jgi:hypothetical protein
MLARRSMGGYFFVVTVWLQLRLRKRSSTPMLQILSCYHPLSSKRGELPPMKALLHLQ